MVWWGTLQGGVGARVQLHALGAHGAGRGLHGGRGRGGLGGGAAVHLARRARAVRRRRAARLLRRRQVRAALCLCLLLLYPVRLGEGPDFLGSTT